MDCIAADLRWFEEERLLPAPVALDRLIDYSYLEAALAELGRVNAPG